MAQAAAIPDWAWVEQKKPAVLKNPTVINLLAGGGAGIAEAFACHPLDTVKVNMQIARNHHGQRIGLFGTASKIASTQGIPGLYRGLSSVLTFIAPKMATRFASFEFYKKHLMANNDGKLSSKGLLLASMAAGVTEAVVVVTPMEVVKIRLQSQKHMAVPKYRNAAHAVVVIVRESGFKGLYSGFGLTALRQGTNQAANLSVYTYLKGKLQDHHGSINAIPTWQTMMIGLVAGAAGPCTNAPIDTLKTRLQSTPSLPGQSSFQRVKMITSELLKQEGSRALYKGVLPRVLRVGPGQAVAYTVYEKIKKSLS